MEKNLQNIKYSKGNGCLFVCKLNSSINEIEKDLQ